MSEIRIGHRIRARRLELGLSQQGLAKIIGISASYLNLIEHNKRRIAGSLLGKLARELDLEMRELSGAEEARLASELMEIAVDPLFQEPAFSEDEAVRLAAVLPSIAHAILSLYRSFQASLEQVDDMAERLSQHPFLADANHQILTLITSIRSYSEILQDYEDLDEEKSRAFRAATVEESKRLSELSTQMFEFLGGAKAKSPYQSPTLEVIDFIADYNNYFDELEMAADDLRKRLLVSNLDVYKRLTRHLANSHGLQIEICAPEQLPPTGHKYFEDSRVLKLSDGLPAETIRFQVARIAGILEMSDVLEKLITSVQMSSDEARDRCRHALASHFAGAFLLPYGEFLNAAKQARYDLEYLQKKFGVTFEQVCHRLTTLQRPDDKAVPFHFLRTDIAGNITKLFSASGLKLPRHGSACPRWVVYEAFLNPGQINTQVAKMDDGRLFFFFAKAITKPGIGYGHPQGHYSLMLGCDIAYAGELIYAEGMDLTREIATTPVGVSCRQCSHSNCGQRAEPTLDDILGGLGRYNTTSVIK